MSETSTQYTPQPVDAAPDSFQQPQMDYFGFGGTERFLFPDKVSYVEYAIMNEGQKARFQRDTQRDLVIQRGGDARTRMDPASERHALIETSLVGWNLKRRRSADGPLEDVPFNAQTRREFLRDANPAIIEKIEVAIRKANPWLTAELSAKELYEQRDELDKLIKEAEEREAGEGSSTSK
jgi:hypothetical protein